MCKFYSCILLKVYAKIAINAHLTLAKICLQNNIILQHKSVNFRKGSPQMAMLPRYVYIKNKDLR